MERCKHKNMKRLYERGKSWESTPLYKCQDCGELLKKGFDKVKSKQLNQEPSLAERTHDALKEDDTVDMEDEQ